MNEINKYIRNLQWHIPWRYYLRIVLELGSVDFHGGKKTREPDEKPLESSENQQLNQTTYVAGSRIQTPIPQLSLGGRHSNHCAIPAPHRFVFYGIFWAGLYNGMINMFIYAMTN